MSFPGRFRVWDKKYKKFQDIKVFKVGGDGRLNNFHDEMIISWSTGLFDKNRKEIFEGDLVEWDDCSGGKYWRVAIVRFDPDICFEITENSKHPLSIEAGYRFHYGAFSYTDTHNHLTVIGNIYEHPKLLK